MVTVANCELRVKLAEKRRADYVPQLQLSSGHEEEPTRGEI